MRWLSPMLSVEDEALGQGTMIFESWENSSGFTYWQRCEKTDRVVSIRIVVNQGLSFRLLFCRLIHVVLVLIEKVFVRKNTKMVRVALTFDGRNRLHCQSGGELFQQIDLHLDWEVKTLHLNCGSDLAIEMKYWRRCVHDWARGACWLSQHSQSTAAFLNFGDNMNFLVGIVSCLFPNTIALPWSWLHSINKISKLVAHKPIGYRLNPEFFEFLCIIITEIATSHMFAPWMWVPCCEIVALCNKAHISKCGDSEFEEFRDNFVIVWRIKLCCTLVSKMNIKLSESGLWRVCQWYPAGAENLIRSSWWSMHSTTSYSVYVYATDGQTHNLRLKLEITDRWLLWSGSLLPPVLNKLGCSDRFWSPSSAFVWPPWNIRICDAYHEIQWLTRNDASWLYHPHILLPVLYVPGMGDILSIKADYQNSRISSLLKKKLSFKRILS